MSKFISESGAGKYFSSVFIVTVADGLTVAEATEVAYTAVFVVNGLKSKLSLAS